MEFLAGHSPLFPSSINIQLTGKKILEACILRLPAADLELSMLVSTPMEARKAAFF